MKVLPVQQVHQTSTNKSEINFDKKGEKNALNFTIRRFIVLFYIISYWIQQYLKGKIMFTIKTPSHWTNAIDLLLIASYSHIKDSKKFSKLILKREKKYLWSFIMLASVLYHLKNIIKKYSKEIFIIYYGQQ